jgi:hypothetical protein
LEAKAKTGKRRPIAPQGLRHISIQATATQREGWELCSKLFDYGEYLSVEIDMEAKTATVLGK